MSNRLRKLRKKLADGGLCVGTWISIPSPIVAEIVADTGFDYVIVDTEHSPFNIETLVSVLLAFRGVDTVPLIRVPFNNEFLIKQVLDQGFEGIVTPNTNTAEDVQRAVNACRYPPMGTRGFGPSRPTGYFRDGGEYARTANETILYVVQIENVKGADEIDKIVKVPGLDWVIIGPRDMSGTVGVFGDIEHPDLWKAMTKIVQTARAAGLPAGIPLDGPASIPRSLAVGSNLFPMGQDLSFLRAGVDKLLADFNASISEINTDSRTAKQKA